VEAREVRRYSVTLNRFQVSSLMNEPYYRYHVFFCINQREGGKPCCADKGSVAMRDYAKARVKELGLDGKGKVRINQAGCLDRCAQGPTVVVYPEGVWYRCSSRDDVNEIIESHLTRGCAVDRLKI